MPDRSDSKRRKKKKDRITVQVVFEKPHKGEWPGTVKEERKTDRGEGTAARSENWLLTKRDAQKSEDSKKSLNAVRARQKGRLRSREKGDLAKLAARVKGAKKVMPGEGGKDTT